MNVGKASISMSFGSSMSFRSSRGFKNQQINEFDKLVLLKRIIACILHSVEGVRFAVWV